MSGEVIDSMIQTERARDAGTPTDTAGQLKALKQRQHEQSSEIGSMSRAGANWNEWKRTGVCELSWWWGTREQ